MKRYYVWAPNRVNGGAQIIEAPSGFIARKNYSFKNHVKVSECCSRPVPDDDQKPD